MGAKPPRFCSKRCQGKTYVPSPEASQRRSERDLAKSTKAKEQTRARIEARIAENPDPLSAQVDHVVPLSQGGDHSYTNVATAHMRCNLAKQDGRPVDRHELLASLGLSVV